MELVVKAGALGVIVAVLCLLLRRDAPVFVPLLSLAAAGAAVLLVSRVLEEVLAFARELTELSALGEPALAIVLKTVAIALIASLAENVCRDAGQTAVASAVELAAALGALYVSLPLLRGVVTMIAQLV